MLDSRLALTPAMSPPARAAGWEARVVSDARGFAALESEWNELAADSLVDHPFCGFDWMRCWWQAFGEGRELRIVVARRGGRAMGIAPLMLTRGRLLGLPVRRLEAMANEQTPRFDFLVARGAESAYDAIWQALREDAQWDVLQLTQAPDTGPTVQALQRLAGSAGSPVGRWAADASPYLVLDEGRDDGYRRVVGRKHRSNVERLARRLAALGPIVLETVSEPRDVASSIDDGFRLEASGWKERIGTAIASQPRVQGFYRSLAQNQAANGDVELVFLKSDGRRIAFLYVVRRGRGFYLLKCGYDPEYARHAPVHVLCHLLFSEASERRLDLIEFLGGNDEWKQRWTHRTVQHVWLYVFRDAWWTRLLCRTKFELVPHLKQQPLCRALFVRLRGRMVPVDSPQLQPSEG